jgi:hypothetical protein
MKISLPEPVRHGVDLSPTGGKHTDCLMTRFTSGLGAPTVRPACDSLGIHFHVTKRVNSRPFPSVPLTARRGRVIESPTSPKIFCRRTPVDRMAYSFRAGTAAPASASPRHTMWLGEDPRRRIQPAGSSQERPKAGGFGKTGQVDRFSKTGSPEINNLAKMTGQI